MTTRVRVGRQVEDFLRALAPEPRRALWRGLKGLAKGTGDLRQLDGRLAPYWRLRVGRMRVVFAIKAAVGERQVLCFYAGYRATVYELVAQLLASGMIEEVRAL